MNPTAPQLKLIIESKETETPEELADELEEEGLPRGTIAYILRQKFGKNNKRVEKALEKIPIGAHDPASTSGTPGGASTGWLTA